MPEADQSVLHMNEMLKADGGLLLATFPIVGIALRLYLTISITNCEGERSFFTLSRVKNHLRTTMTQQRLQALSLVCIESEVLQSIDFNDLINDFAIERLAKVTYEELKKLVLILCYEHPH